MTTPKGRTPPTTEAVDAAIAQHIRSAASLMAAKTDHGGPGSTSDAEIIARLDLILATLKHLPLNQKERVVERVVEHPIPWVKLEKYVELTGDSVDSVQSRRRIGGWLDGNQCKIVNGRLWIDLRAVQRWIEEWDSSSPMLAAGYRHLKKPKK